MNEQWLTKKEEERLVLVNGLQKSAQRLDNESISHQTDSLIFIGLAGLNAAGALLTETMYKWNDVLPESLGLLGAACLVGAGVEWRRERDKKNKAFDTWRQAFEIEAEED